MSGPDERDGLELETRFVMVPTWVLDAGVSSRAVHVYALLYGHADRTTRAAWPSRKFLADRLGCSTSSVDRPIRELLAIRALTRRQRWDENGAQRSSVYIVHSSPRGAGETPSPRVRTPLTTGDKGGVDNVLGTVHPLTTRDKGPLSPAGQRTRTKLTRERLSPSEVTQERPEVHCPHGEPRGFGYCALCRTEERIGRSIRPPAVDHAALAAGEHPNSSNDEE